MGKLTKIRINIERFFFRIKRDKAAKKDIVEQLKIINKAEKLSKERKCRLWVVRIEPCVYRIYSKGDVKAILRKIGLKGRIDMFSINGSVVHITK